MKATASEHQVTGLAAVLAVIFLLPAGLAGQEVPPIIDMHLHAGTADEYGPPPLGLCTPMLEYAPEMQPGQSWEEAFIEAFENPTCPDPIWSPESDDALMRETIAALETHNVVGVLSGPPERVLRWTEMAPDRFIPSLQFQLGRDEISPDSMRQLFETAGFMVLGEVSNQYVGISPDDPRMRPYWALAEELDFPVAIHMGEGPAGAAALIPTYRAHLSSPFLLEEVLARHPGLRISIMHYGSPLLDQTIAMLGAYPRLYIDLGGIQWFYPREYFYMQLRMLVEAGFDKRVMFGSDQINWPGVIERAIAIIDEAPFLTDEQKRDILYNNAARFLRLSEDAAPRTGT